MSSGFYESCGLFGFGARPLSRDKLNEWCAANASSAAKTDASRGSPKAEQMCSTLDDDACLTNGMCTLDNGKCVLREEDKCGDAKEGVCGRNVNAA